MLRIIGRICQIFLYGIFIFIIGVLINIIRKTTQEKIETPEDRRHFFQILHSAKGDPMNLVGLIFLLIFQLILITIKVGFDFKGHAGDIPGLFFTVFPLGILVFLGFENIIKHSLGIQKKSRFGFPNETDTQSKKVQVKVDIKRKIWHLLIFFIILGMIFGGEYLLKQQTVQNPSDLDLAALYTNFWGTAPEYSYLSVIFRKESLPFGQTIIVFVLYGAMMIFLTIDLSRLSKNVHFILQKNAHRHIRFKELDTFASYTHFCASYLTVAIILPPPLFLGALCQGCFADPASSIIGMNFGKKRYHWNQKSLEGTLAGSLAGFISMSVFVGPIYALFGTLVFIFVDLITPKPIKLSDNLLLPLITMIVFICLAFIGINSFNLISI